MAEKFTSAIALALVERIEALSEQIYQVYREANEYDGLTNSTLVRELVAKRADADDARSEADGLLASLDLETDDDGNIIEQAA